MCYYTSTDTFRKSDKIVKSFIHTKTNELSSGFNRADFQLCVVDVSLIPCLWSDDWLNHKQQQIQPATWTEIRPQTTTTKSQKAHQCKTANKIEVTAIVKNGKFVCPLSTQRNVPLIMLQFNCNPICPQPAYFIFFLHRIKFTPTERDGNWDSIGHRSVVRTVKWIKLNVELQCSQKATYCNMMNNVIWLNVANVKLASSQNCWVYYIVL